MAPTIPLAPHSATYTPTSDALARHEYGVTKVRKTASTGGGRAWSEDEELYLLQTRLQKMPYKHIAAHLKKTELACRLHYHQLSHGSNRRKRTTSVSSGSSSNGHSPLMPMTAQSPIREVPTSNPPSPPGSAGSYGPRSPHDLGGPIQLPSIVGSHTSPRLPAILPKPAAMTLPPLNTSPASRGGYPTPLPEPHSAALPSSTGFPSAGFPSAGYSSAGFPSATFPPPLSARPATPPLRLECSVLPPPSARHAHVDMGRLQAIYAAHRASFWAAVAADYGGANPHALEQAWKAGYCCGPHGAAPPLTPAASPENSGAECGRDRTRISAILGMETLPRSPRDEQMVRRMDEERHLVPASA
ncbi:uncharacterized protein DNG_05779 [Cephalotrichum gorgonifer]|uniref:Myb-like domain-containing protein n=1 Tax=Cephalotrichum gorgonifer TaxID=2041049 RepID=A0AAE8MYX3_9PEZI|nr:uncharacterized protein DNG_05779 [Cephalotrichum gorgonifer]